MGNYNNSVIVKATPDEVYEVLMDSKKHEELTGGPAEITTELKGKSSYFGGNITGINKVLEPGKKIVQDWSIKPWQEMKLSTNLTITIEKVEEGTKVVFDHQGIPDENFEMISGGWEQNYIAKLPDYFSK